MQQVLVAVLVALALLQPVRPQVGAQETEDNHSTNSGFDVHCNDWVNIIMDLCVVCMYMYVHVAALYAT